MKRIWTVLIATAAIAILTSSALASWGPESLFFKPGMPREDSTLSESLLDPADGLAALQTNLVLAQRLKTTGYRFKVTGDADSQECLADECEALSLRRAKLVHRWLVNHGVDPALLIEPMGYGVTRPIAPPEDPGNNRRAQFDLMPPEER